MAAAEHISETRNSWLYLELETHKRESSVDGSSLRDSAADVVDDLNSKLPACPTSVLPVRTRNP